MKDSVPFLVVSEGLVDLFTCVHHELEGEKMSECDRERYRESERAIAHRSMLDNRLLDWLASNQHKCTTLSASLDRDAITTIGKRNLS